MTVPIGAISASLPLKCGMVLLICLCTACAGWAAHPPLRVSQDQRYLVEADGSPFLWIGDTAWHLVGALGREDIDFYLDDRKARGFTVIQATAVMGQPSPIGLTRNPRTVYGHRAFHGGDEPRADRPLIVEGGSPTAPNEYWDHLDYVVSAVKQRGLYLAILPCWGSHHVNGRARGGQAVIFDSAKAKAYAEFLGKRYKDQPHLVWVLGGDINPDERGDKRLIYRRMAEGLVQGVTGQEIAWNQQHPAWDRLLMTYHPRGPHSSSEWFHHDPWLDFHMIQSFRYRELVADLVSRDYALADPRKPTVMGEPAYEGDPPDPYAVKSGPLDVRRQAYQSFFNGTCGFTYGMLQEGEYGPLYAFESGWKKCLDQPGAIAVAGPLRRLLAARPWWNFIPDTGIVVRGGGEDQTRKAAMRSRDGKELLVYFPDSGQAVIRLDKRLGKLASAEWFDPQCGSLQPIEGHATSRTGVFCPPKGWDDAVLILAVQ